MAASTSARVGGLGQHAREQQPRARRRTPATSARLTSAKRTRRAFSIRTRPVIRQVPRIAITSVCIAAVIEPKRLLRTPETTKSWKWSVGIRTRSSRNGIAVLMLPKTARSPAPPSAGYCGEVERQPRVPGDERHEADAQHLRRSGGS